MVAVHAAEQLVDRHAQRLAFEIPQREIQRADSVEPFAPGRVVKCAIHVLPHAFDVERVPPDQAARAGFQRVASAAFTDAGDVGVGLDGDDHVALQERYLQRHDRGALRKSVSA